MSPLISVCSARVCKEGWGWRVCGGDEVRIYLAVLFIEYNINLVLHWKVEPQGFACSLFKLFFLRPLVRSLGRSLSHNRTTTLVRHTYLYSDFSCYYIHSGCNFYILQLYLEVPLSHTTEGCIYWTFYHITFTPSMSALFSLYKIVNGTNTIYRTFSSCYSHAFMNESMRITALESLFKVQNFKQI